MKASDQEHSRRDFIKATTLGAGGLLLASGQLHAAADVGDRLTILNALCETIIPSRPGDPSFKDLEPHGITEEVNKALRPLKDEAFIRFNDASKPFFGGRTFVALPEDERARFLRMLIKGEEITDKSVFRVYKYARMTALKVFYSNFPEHRVARDANGIPVGDAHQITTPNTTQLKTGWDVANYRGPLTWAQEERLRAEAQKVHWHDDIEQIVVRYRPKSA